MTSPGKYDTRALEVELEFLKDNPQFSERPATIEEFLGPDYLNIAERVRPGVKRALIGIFGATINPNSVSHVRRAIFTGGIGIGKTTFASIAIPYMVHWVYCLRSPQAYFGLMDGTRIAFMLMSTTESQAKEVLFGDIKARIENSPWFKRNCMYDKDFKNQLRFADKDIWVLPGNSAETSFEGYNILAGILDEGDSHKQTANKDFAESGYDTIHARIDSRFNDPKTGSHRGLLIVIGQMKRASGFIAKKKKELEKDPEALVVSMTIWESLGWDKFLDSDGSRKSFYYDTRHKAVVPKMAALLVDSKFIIEVPLSYQSSFVNNPEKAMRDLAGIPPEADSPFISLVDRIDECHERWEESHADQDGAAYVPVGPDPVRPSLHRDVFATDTIKRVAHIDIAISANGDALGLAVGHVSSLVDIDDELKPYITFDFLMRLKAAPGTEIILGDIRKILYDLVDERKFKLAKVTMDGFQSTDTRQQLNKRKIPSDYLSVDKSLAPYYDLREAIYERRVEWPKYMTYISLGDTTKVNIANKELRELSEVGHKVDHPKDGSKDVADAMAGVVYTLMGDRQYRRVARVARTGYGEPTASDNREPFSVGSNESVNGRYGGLLQGLEGLSAPIPHTTTALSAPHFPSWHN